MALSPVPNLGGGGSGGPSSSAVAAANAVARFKSNLTPEYMEAMQIMTERNMSQACEWLLSERDYDDETNGKNNSINDGDESTDSSGEKSDQTKLLEFFGRCQHAMKAIEKQVANTPLSPVLPSAPSLAPSSRVGGVGAQSRGSLPKLKQKAGGVMAGSSKQGVIPMRARTTANHMMNRTAATGGGGQPQSAMKRGMEREASLSSLGDEGSVSSSGDNVSNKKARLSPPTTGKDVKAPPPSALNFLAKLNKDGSSAGSVGDGSKDRKVNSQRSKLRRGTSS